MNAARLSENRGVATRIFAALIFTGPINNMINSCVSLKKLLAVSETAPAERINNASFFFLFGSPGCAYGDEGKKKRALATAAPARSLEKYHLEAAVEFVFFILSRLLLRAKRAIRIERTMPRECPHVSLSRLSNSFRRTGEMKQRLD